MDKPRTTGPAGDNHDTDCDRGICWCADPEHDGDPPGADADVCDSTGIVGMLGIPIYDDCEPVARLDYGACVGPCDFRPCTDDDCDERHREHSACIECGSAVLGHLVGIGDDPEDGSCDEPGAIEVNPDAEPDTCDCGLARCLECGDDGERNPFEFHGYAAADIDEESGY